MEQAKFSLKPAQVEQAQFSLMIPYPGVEPAAGRDVRAEALGVLRGAPERRRQRGVEGR